MLKKTHEFPIETKRGKLFRSIWNKQPENLSDINNFPKEKNTASNLKLATEQHLKPISLNQENEFHFISYIKRKYYPLSKDEKKILFKRSLEGASFYLTETFKLLFQQKEQNNMTYKDIFEDSIESFTILNNLDSSKDFLNAFCLIPFSEKLNEMIFEINNKMITEYNKERTSELFNFYLLQYETILNELLFWEDPEHSQYIPKYIELLIDNGLIYPDGKTTGNLDKVVLFLYKNGFTLSNRLIQESFQKENGEEYSSKTIERYITKANNSF